MSRKINGRNGHNGTAMATITPVVPNHPTSFEIRFRRKVKRVTDLNDKIDAIVDASLANGMDRNWSGSAQYIPDDTPDLNGDKHQMIYLQYKWISRKQNIDPARVDKEIEVITRNASYKMGKFGGPQWYQVDDELNPLSGGIGKDDGVYMYVTWEKLKELFDARPDKLWAMTDEEISDHPAFNHIYGCEHIIRMLARQVRHAVETEGRELFHCAIFGPPGVAKSSIMSALCDWINYPVMQWDSEYRAVERIDTEGASAAGILNRLMEQAASVANLAPILLIEEIEKVANEQFWKCMLPALDARQTLSKLTYRVNKKVHTPILALATANDMSRFEEFLSGAIASRFSKKIEVARPTFDIMRKILTKRVEDIGGDLQWVDAVMQIGARLKIHDPREFISMLAGRESLIPEKGETISQYEKDIMKCHAAARLAEKTYEEKEKEEEANARLLQQLYS